LKNKP